MTHSLVTVALFAKLLRGKYKPNFTPHVDCGDNVIIIKADKVKLTGNKWNDKVYLSYTGYPGGQREIDVYKRQPQKCTGGISTFYSGNCYRNI